MISRYRSTCLECPSDSNIHEMASSIVVANAPALYGGTVSQANTGSTGGVVGESVPGTQRVVANASHWWLQHGEDEPLPRPVPVRTDTSE